MDESRKTDEIPEPDMSRRERTLGFIYLPLHYFILPLLVALGVPLIPGISVGQWNLIYYGLGAAYLGVFFLPWLQRQFEALLDRPGRAFFGFASALALDIVLSAVMAAVLMALGMEGENPNDEAIMSTAGRDFVYLKAVAIFLAPVLAETLFRGVLFGSLRRRGAVPAYLVTVLLFCFYHVWQYLVKSGDVSLLLYMLPYVPVSLSLCWCYDRAGTIWAPILMHMGINALTYAVSSLL